MLATADRPKPLPVNPTITYRFHCPRCRTAHERPYRLAGQRLRIACQGCGATVRVRLVG